MELSRSETHAPLIRGLQHYEDSASEIDGFLCVLLLFGTYCRIIDKDFAIIGQRADLQTVTSTPEIVALVEEVSETFQRMVAIHERIREVSRRTAEAACPVCLEKFRDPEATPCGHVFCRECLAKWLKTHSACPSCRRDVQQDDQRSIDEEVAEMDISEHRN